MGLATTSHGGGGRSGIRNDNTNNNDNTNKSASYLSPHPAGTHQCDGGYVTPLSCMGPTNDLAYSSSDPADPLGEFRSVPLCEGECMPSLRGLGLEFLGRYPAEIPKMRPNGGQKR